MLEIHPIHIILTNEKGNPDSKAYSADELKAPINGDIRFTTVIEQWNEYVVDDGTTIKIRPLVLKIAKTSKFDSKGFPKYICEIRGDMKMESPHHEYKKMIFFVSFYVHRICLSNSNSD